MDFNISRLLLWLLHIIKWQKVHLTCMHLNSLLALSLFVFHQSILLVLLRIIQCRVTLSRYLMIIHTAATLNQSIFISVNTLQGHQLIRVNSLIIPIVLIH